jgi:hypothetical protein
MMMINMGYYSMYVYIYNIYNEGDLQAWVGILARYPSAETFTYLMQHVTA